MLGQRSTWWAYNKLTLGQRFMVVGNELVPDVV